jgi:hypothetical protein
MQCDRWTELSESVESIEDPFNHIDGDTMLEMASRGTRNSALGDFDDLGAWWQTLRAQVQLPGAAD